MIHRTAIHAFLILLPLVTAACSGGGGGGSASAPVLRDVNVLVDTGAATDDVVEARIELATLESANSGFTPNLLEAPTTVRWSHPLGTPSGLKLAKVPEGTYVALHLLVSAASTQVRHANGQLEAVELARLDLRIPFEEPVRAPGLWLHLHHQGPLGLTRNGGGQLTWTPQLVGRTGQLQPLPETSVVTLETSAGTALASLVAAGGMLVTLRFDDSSRLTSEAEGGRLSRDRFLELHGKNGEIEIEGELHRDGSLRVTAGHGRRQSSTSGPESKVLGRITSLEAATRSFLLQVQVIVRGATALPRSPLPELRIFTAAARIYASHSKDTALDFTALQSGSLVEVEWKGEQAGPDIQASEVEIEDQSGNQNGPEIEGMVGEVRTNDATILVVPRRNDPLWVNGKSVPSARIVVGPETRIVRQTSSGLVTITLAEVTTQDRIWILGRTVSDQRVEASLVRVRDESR